MSHQPYPHTGRALRHIVRAHRRTRQPTTDPRIEVHLYPGTVTTEVAEELRRIIRKEALRGTARR
ncbi:hypothetical protein ABTX35_01485 [Streptomyces sp. NPDC096080]|uniref:hypothetical protein n=1 Tax=Streptomyces sp. NPDC096080 TaxID=3156693 RepID=UPI00331C3F7C